MPGPPLDAIDVDVVGQHVVAEGEVPDRGSGVGADAGKPCQIVRPPFARDRLSRAVQSERAPVVPEPLPGSDHVGRRCRRERFRRRPALEPVEVARDDAIDLRLLQHDLADEDRVRVARMAPGEVASELGVPRREPSLHRS